MSTRPRVSSAIPGQAPQFSSVLMHQSELLRRFAELYGELWQRGLVAQRVKEITRLRNARRTGCGF